MSKKFIHRSILSLIFLIFVILLVQEARNCQVYAQGFTCSQPPVRKINSQGWIDNDRGLVLTSDWFKRHQYVDCSSHNNGFWFNQELDCMINDQHEGPTNEETQIVPVIQNLYYKHFTPIDGLSILNSTVSSYSELSPNELSDAVRNLILQKIAQNPLPWLDKSFDSLYLGLEGGQNGKIVKNASVLVHPIIEGPLASLKNPDGTKARVQNLYQPFIEQAIGKSISFEQAKLLYENALYNCGDNALYNNQKGRNFKIDLQGYTAVVQYWQGGSDHAWFTNTHDCRIAVYPN